MPCDRPIFDLERPMFTLTPVTGLQSGLVALMISSAAIALFGPPNAEPLFSETAAAVQDEIAAPVGKNAMEKFMARKLAAAQQALEGVAREDYEQVQEMTAEMIDLSRHEAWERMASARFVQDTADFVTAAEFLSRMAEGKDAEGVSLGFMRLTLSCTNCHAHVRSSSVANLIPKPPAADSALFLSALEK